MRKSILMVALLVLAAGCMKKAQEAPRQLSERQRDSLIGVSQIPGGFVVTRALAASDSSAARANRMGRDLQKTDDSQAQDSQGSPP